MTNPRTPWTPAENAALIRLYFRMLDAATAGVKYNKAALIRMARESGGLGNRTRGSIEAKLMNASAAHADLNPGDETMATHGYKAWGNYQATLRDAMHRELNRREIDRKAQA